MAVISIDTDESTRSIHVVSQVHSIIIVPLALRTLHLSALEKDRAFGWHPDSGFVQAIACGRVLSFLFLWEPVLIRT